MDGFRKRVGLAMAGKSPWGKGGGGKRGSDDDQPASDSDGGGEGSDGGSDSGKGRGPRNPWLPPTDGPRRAANIEDLFKQRGPEGPRRGSGGGPRGPNFRFPERPGGKSWLPILALGVVSLVLLFSMFHQIAPRQQAVVTTFGKYSRTLEPGLNMTLPWPFQQVDRENVQEIRLQRIPEGNEQKLVLTGDQNLVDLSYIVRWNVKDLKQYKFQLADPTLTVTEVAESAMRAAVAETTLDYAFSGAGRAQIEERVLSRMQALLDAYRAGITIQGVEIAKTDPPSEVNDAFRDVSVAEQDANAAMNRSRATAQRILAQAEGETEAFDKVYEEYRLAPQVTRRRLYYETMERVLSQVDKTVVETGGVNAYLPLPELRRRAQQQAQPEPAAPAAPANRSQGQ